MIKRFRSLDHVEIVTGVALRNTFLVDSIEINLCDKGWKFGGWIHGDRNLGRAHYRTKEIYLNKNLYLANLSHNPAKLLDTILHEIAHAIHWELYEGHDHGYDWRRIARQVGARPEEKYKYNEIAHPATKFQLVCDNCATAVNIARRPKRSYSCCLCAPGHYNPKFLLKLKQNF